MFICASLQAERLVNIPPRSPSKGCVLYLLSEFVITSWVDEALAT